jgi:Flp pilus assembly protein TadG
MSDRNVAAGVDLAEALAAKTALEEAGIQAADAVIRRAATEMKKK